MPAKTPPKTTLGAALRARRGEQRLVDAAEIIGLPFSTLARIERGGVPGLRTALALSGWLGEGWTVERVIRAGLEQLPAEQLAEAAADAPRAATG